MKKLLAALLCICMLTSLAACSENTPPATSTTATTVATTVTTMPVTSSPEEDAVATYDGHLTAVALPTITETVNSDDGTQIFVYSYPNVSVAVQDADIAEIISLDLLNRVDVTAASAQQLHEAAKAAYTPGTEFQSYRYDVQYTVTRLDQNILSIYCTESSFDGSPRSLRSAYSITYDLATGNSLSLRTVLQNEYSADVLCELIIDGLTAYDSAQFFPDYETTILDKFSTNVPVESWYFTAEGLCFYFEPYEIAPISMGDIISVIPYEKLSGMMDEQFFPAEQPNYFGKPILSDITGNIEASMKEYTQFSDLTLEVGVNQLLLTADGSVTELRIFNQDENGEQIMLYAATGTGPTDAILIEADISKLDGKLIISYKDGTETKTLLATVSATGEITLAE